MAFSVAWDSYQNNICNGLSLLQQRGRFVDMTIAADGHHVKAHQMVLSLVSPYISDLISSAACPHPVIFLNQVSYITLQSILQYAYTGEVLVTRDNISEFLEACKALHIRGVEGLSISGQNLEQLTETETSTEDLPLKKWETETTETSFLEKHENTASDNDDTMDSTDHHEHVPYHCGRRSPDQVQNQPISQLNSKSISDNLQYTVSLKGSLQLVCNRYLYFLMSSRKSGERMWRCMSYKKRKGMTTTCRAFLVTKDNKIIKRVGAHGHPFHDAQLVKRLNKGNMFTALNEVESHVENIKNNPGTSNEPNSHSASVITSRGKKGGHMPLVIE